MAEKPVATTRTKTRLRLRTLDSTAAVRHTSWLELFFDLVFVIAVAQIALILSGHTDIAGLIKYLALFAAIWWSWVGFTFYADRFETEESVYRILMFAAMLAVTGLSLTLGGAFSPQGDPPFIVCYVLVRLVLIALYARAAYYIPLARSFSTPYILGLAVSTGLLLISLLFEAPARYAIWAMTFVLELAVPLLNRRATRSIPVDRSHIPERFGLFTIIVLGETVIATANSAALVQWSLATITMACFGFAMAACIWWINFDFVEDSALTSPALVPRFVYLYGHFFIVASIVAVGVGVEHAIKESVEPYLHFPTLSLLTVGLTIFLVAITIIRLITGVCNLLYTRIAAIVALLSLLYFGRMLPPLAVVLALLVLLSAAVWVEGYYAEEKAELDTPQLSPCEHAGEMKVFRPRSTDGCEECRKNSYKWVHLRLCLSCGHVGCCNTSIHKHATKHFHKSEHPIAASLQPGENWAWCYIDERFVPPPKRV